MKLCQSMLQNVALSLCMRCELLWWHSVLLTGNCSRSCHSTPPLTWTLVQHTYQKDAGIGVLKVA